MNCTAAFSLCVFTSACVVSSMAPDLARTRMASCISPKAELRFRIIEKSCRSRGLSAMTHLLLSAGSLAERNPVGQKAQLFPLGIDVILGRAILDVDGLHLMAAGFGAAVAPHRDGGADGNQAFLEAGVGGARRRREGDIPDLVAHLNF